MKISAQYLAEGDKLPPWYYGFAYEELWTDHQVWCVIPWNFVARWWRYKKMKWDTFRGKADSVTLRIRRISRRREFWAWCLGRDGFLKRGERLEKK